MSVDLKALCAAAKIELEGHGKYPKKQYRTCECWGNFLSAVVATVGAMENAHASEIKRLTKTSFELADRSSAESEKRASLAERVSKLEHVAIGRGLAETNLPSETQARILNVNGG